MNSPPNSSAESIDTLLERLSRQLDTRSHVVAELLEGVAQRARPGLSGAPLDDALRERVVVEYQRLGKEHPRRAHLLRLLAADGTNDSLVELARLLLDDPPLGNDAGVLLFTPLFQSRTWPVGALFPALLEALDQPVLTAAVLDLANYITRQGRTPLHPATGHVDRLAELLGRLAQLLSQVEESPERFGLSPQLLSARVAEALALIVPLCDALGLIGDPRVTGKLYQVRELGHRRLRVEASAALAKLGDDSGFETLVTLAAEPAVRTRVLAYLKELGAESKIPAEYSTPEARAAGNLAAWMAQPTRWGIAPRSLEMVDHCRQFWPGFEEPVDCFLFDCELPGKGEGFSIIGLAGPLTAATNVDLADLPPADIYAFYAGRSLNHDAIETIPVGRLSADQLREWTAIKAELRERGFEELELHAWGQFFEYRHWVAAARREGRPGVVIAGDDEPSWYAQLPGERAPGIDDWHAIHQGRIVLRTFNPPPAD